MQSFLKARPIAGDMSLGRRAVETIEALILERGRMGGRETLASSIDRMRRRLQEGAQDGPAGSPSVKLGEEGFSRSLHHRVPAAAPRAAQSERQRHPEALDPPP